MYIPTPDELAMDGAHSFLDEVSRIAGRPEFGPALPSDLPPSWKDKIWGHNAEVDGVHPLAVAKPAPLIVTKRPAPTTDATKPIAKMSATRTAAVPTPATTIREKKHREKHHKEGKRDTKREARKEKKDAPVSGPDLPPLPASWKERIWGPTTSSSSRPIRQPTPATAAQKATYIKALRKELEYEPSSLKAHLPGHGPGDWVQKEKLRITIRRLLSKQGMSLQLQLAMEVAAKEAGVEFSAEEAKDMLWDMMDGLRDEKVDRKPWLFGGDVDRVSEGWDVREAKEIIERELKREKGVRRSIREEV